MHFVGVHVYFCSSGSKVIKGVNRSNLSKQSDSRYMSLSRARAVTGWETKLSWAWAVTGWETTLGRAWPVTGWETTRPLLFKGIPYPIIIKGVRHPVFFLLLLLRNYCNSTLLWPTWIKLNPMTYWQILCPIRCLFFFFFFPHFRYFTW